MHSCPPRAFLPALCQIFPDPTATPQILEVTARALTYYLDVSTECTHRIVGVEGAVAAIASRISPSDETEESARARIEEPNVKDLVEQCQGMPLPIIVFCGTRVGISLISLSQMTQFLHFSSFYEYT